MNARLNWWLHEWDWRPLARTIVWLGIAIVALKRSGYRPPTLAVVLHEVVLGFLLTAGLLTRFQLGLLCVALRLFFALDDWTYAAADWIVRPVTRRARFAVQFLGAFAAQFALLKAALALWPWALTYITRRL